MNDPRITQWLAGDRPLLADPGDLKMIEWLKETDPIDPRYKSFDELDPDQIKRIGKLKSEGKPMKQVTHAVNCSLKVAYDAINLYCIELLNQVHLGQSHLEPGMSLDKLNGIFEQFNGGEYLIPTTAIVDDLEYMQTTMTLGIPYEVLGPNVDVALSSIPPDTIQTHHNGT